MFTIIRKSTLECYRTNIEILEQIIDEDKSFIEELKEEIEDLKNELQYYYQYVDQLKN